MNKWVKIALVAVGVLVVLFVASMFLSNKPKLPVEAGSFITSNPFDLTQIASISKFRSCEGHNFSGFNANGVEETYRTMKHYVSAIDGLTETTGKVKILAPFDGKVSRVSDDSSRGSIVSLAPKEDSSGWDVLFIHIDLLNEFNNNGAKIKSGEHIGYANLENGANFDLSLKYFGLGDQRHGTPFLHMTDEVLAEYSAAGVTPNNIITSKEERDASPCKLAPGQTGRDAFYDRSEAGKSWVELVQK